MAKKGLGKGLKIFAISWLFLGILVLGIKFYMDRGDIQKVTGTDTIFCVSNQVALAAGYLDGSMTVEALKKSGNFGFGLKAGGEMGYLKLDKKDYLVDGELTLVPAAAEDEVTFGRTNQFDTDYAETIESSGESIEAMLRALEEKQTSANHIYAYKITGSDIVSVTVSPFSILVDADAAGAKTIANPAGVIYLTTYPAQFWNSTGPYDAIYVDKEAGIGGIVTDVAYQRLSIAVDLTNSLFFYLPSNEKFQKLDLAAADAAKSTEVEE